MVDIPNLPGRDILPYDFCLPIDLSKLENSRMKLVPFEVSVLRALYRLYLCSVVSIESAKRLGRSH